MSIISRSFTEEKTWRGVDSVLSQRDIGINPEREPLMFPQLEGELYRALSAFEEEGVTEREARLYGVLCEALELLETMDLLP